MNNQSKTAHQQLRTLWVDLKTSVHLAEVPPAFEELCEIHRRYGLAGNIVETIDPDLAVLEFDYPSKVNLREAASFKASHPSVPMIILTVQHSEAMAVWFFRKKFLDYLVQPVGMGEARQCLSEISKITLLRRKQSPRQLNETKSAMPLEVSDGRNASQALLPAIALVESAYYEQLTVTRAADTCRLTPFKFGRLFKEEFGIDFRDYVVRHRIREACRLLRNPNAQVSDVSYAVGFSEPSYFTKTFKRLLGAPPSHVIGHRELEFDVESSNAYRNSMSSS